MASSVAGNRARAAHTPSSNSSLTRLRWPGHIVRLLSLSALLSGLCNAAEPLRPFHPPPEPVHIGKAATGVSTPHPIHPASAEKYRSELDWSDSGPDALSFRRIYRSNWGNDASRITSGLDGRTTITMCFAPARRPTPLPSLSFCPKAMCAPSPWWPVLPHGMPPTALMPCRARHLAAGVGAAPTTMSPSSSMQPGARRCNQDFAGMKMPMPSNETGRLAALWRFTTKQDGHGFGRHSGALAAREMGGSLTVHSDGPGKGAAFTLELPVQSSGGAHG